MLAGEDEQGAQYGGGPGGIEAEPGEDPPLLGVGEAVLDGGAGSGQGLVSVPLGKRLAESRAWPYRITRSLAAVIIATKSNFG